MATIGEVIDTLTDDQAEVVTNMLENGVEALSPEDAEVLENHSYQHHPICCW